MKYVVLLALMVFQTVSSQEMMSVPEKHQNIKKQTAIQGYDPVAYFTSDKAMKGSEEYTAIYDHAEYHFSSETNKELFEKEPSKYVPQYGGWCAYAIGAAGKKFAINPETYQVKEGKLYLFYNEGKTNTYTLWKENEAELRDKADENWVKIIEK